MREKLFLALGYVDLFALGFNPDSFQEKTLQEGVVKVCPVNSENVGLIPLKLSDLFLWFSKRCSCALL